MPPSQGLQKGKQQAKGATQGQSRQQPASKKESGFVSDVLGAVKSIINELKEEFAYRDCTTKQMHDMTGIWERYNDAAEGTKIQIIIEDDCVVGRIIEVKGKLLEVGFEDGEIKWKQFQKNRNGSFQFWDLGKSSRSSGQYIKHSMKISSDRKQIHMSRKVLFMSFGDKQDWRKIQTAK